MDNEPARIKITDRDGDDREGPTCPPWADVRMTEQEGYAAGPKRCWWDISDTQTPFVPNSEPTEGRGDSRFPNALSVETPKRANDLDIALDYIGASLSQHLHELLEWVTVDGRRLGNPHPEFDTTRDDQPDADPYGYWDWSIARLRRVAKDYCKRYPPMEERDAG